jgi:hypothetical protein
LGHKIVAEALRAEGAHVECHTDHFAEDAPDDEWLPEVGKRGWIVLSKDKHLKSNPLEVIALLRANTFSFLLTSGSLTGSEMGRAFVAAMPDMLGIIATSNAPLVASVGRSGAVRAVYGG